MTVVIDGTNGITTPDLESAGPISGTTGTFSGNVTGVDGTFSGDVTVNGVTLRPLVPPIVKAWNWNGLSTNTFIDFESIPSWVTRVTATFSGASVNTVTTPFPIRIQIGDSGGIANTLYSGAYTDMGGAVSTTALSDGFDCAIWNTAAILASGSLVITKGSGNTWTAQGVTAVNTPRTAVTAGSRTLTNALDRVRFTTPAGTAAFDAGTFSITYE